MTATAELTLTGDMDHLRLVWQMGETLLQQIPFREEDPEAHSYHILVAIQEMVTNVLRHGYEMDVNRPIQVGFEVDQEHFAIELRDSAPEFNPLAHQTESLTQAETSQPAEGGYGIHIAKMFMDEVSYERRGGLNVLRMVKSVSSLQAAGASDSMTVEQD